MLPDHGPESVLCEKWGEEGESRKFSPEFKDDSVRLVIDGPRPIAQVARELGINERTLGNWVNIYREEHAADEAALDLSERSRLREAEREFRELRMENDSSNPRNTGMADHRRLRSVSRRSPPRQRLDRCPGPRAEVAAVRLQAAE